MMLVNYTITCPSMLYYYPPAGGIQPHGDSHRMQQLNLFDALASVQLPASTW